MLRIKVTDFEQCEAMLKFMRGLAGSGWGFKDFHSRTMSQYPKLAMAFGRGTSGYPENTLRNEGQFYVPDRIHSFCRNAFTVTQVRVHPVVAGGLTAFLPYSVRGISTLEAQLARKKSIHDERSDVDLAKPEDPFDSITDKIPERPVSVVEGASYSVVILLGLAIAGSAAYAVFKELIFEPKEYKVFGKALDRVQHDSQVSALLGRPITGYGQESRNRAARQRISNRAWTDEIGIERLEVMFYIRGPSGAGKVYSEMFKDPADKTWKFTYLIVDMTSPTPTRLLIESYVPPSVPLNTL